MKHFRLMRVEDIGRLEGEYAEIQPGLALLAELDEIGRGDVPVEYGFHRRMLKLAGFDIDKGVSLDHTERVAYVDALNRLIGVWNGLKVRPSCREFESALCAELAIRTDAQ